MGAFLWLAFDWTTTLCGILIGMMWVGTIMMPRKTSEGMGMSLRQCYWLLVQFSVIWLVIFAGGYWLARSLGWTE